MSAARPFFRLAILPILLLTGAAQGQDDLPQLHAVVPHPAGIAAMQICPSRITDAFRHELVPDFRKLTYDVARRCAGQLKLPRNDQPNRSAPAGTIVDQDPQSGVSIPGDRTVTLFVSTGPPANLEAPPPPIATQTCANGSVVLATDTCPPTAPAVAPPAPPPPPQPPPVSGVELSNADAVAGSPLHFTVTLGPNGTGGKISFATLGGNARPQVDYDPVRGNLNLSPASQPVVIEVPTHQSSDAAANPQVLMVIVAGKQVLARAIGTIRQQPPPPAKAVVNIRADTVVAPAPLHFTIAFQPGTPGGTASYYTEGGSAKPGVDYDSVKGEVAVDPTTGMQVVEVPTHANANAAGDRTVGMVVLANDEVLAREFGTIRQPTPPKPPECVTGNEPSCEPPPCTTGTEPSCPPRCKDGTPEPCPTWPIPDLLPFLVIGVSFGIAAGAVSLVWPRPPKLPIEQPETETENPPKGPPQLSDIGFDVATSKDAAPPAFKSTGKGPKSPIVSLTVKTTREDARIIAATRPEDGENG